MALLLLLLAAAPSHMDEPALDQLSILPYNTAANASAVTHMHMIWSNHFDAGFDDISWFYQPLSHWPQNAGGSPFAYRVLQNYFSTYFPAAVARAAHFRSINQTYAWMTQEWIINLYLDCEASGIVEWASPNPLDAPSPSAKPLLRCPNASATAAMRAAIMRGDIFFHAFPHNPSFGTLDLNLLRSGLREVKRTADALGIAHPTTLSLRDVPGLTRSIVPHLVDANVDFISLGSGGPHLGHPDIPGGSVNTSLFTWRDARSGKSVLFAHDDGYGGGVHIAPNGHALYCAWNKDNSGPIEDPAAGVLIAKLAKAYPNAKIFASTLDAFGAAVDAEARAALPVLSSEIGDTWAYGAGSDPLKLQLSREIGRRYTACIARGQCKTREVAVQRFERLLLKIPEHTWGTDIPCYYGDIRNYTNAELYTCLNDRDASSGRYNLPNYETTLNSWREQRSYIPHSIAMLRSDGASSEARAFADELDVALLALRAPVVPNPASLSTAVAWTRVPSAQATSTPFHCASSSATITFAKSGAVASFATTTKATGKSTTHFTGRLGEFAYQTVDSLDYSRFGAKYGPNNNTSCDVPYVANTSFWNCHTRVRVCNTGANFGKPNMSAANPVSRIDVGTMSELWRSADSCEFLTRVVVPTERSELAGAPREVWSSLRVFGGSDSDGATIGASLDFNVTWVNKSATKLPEAVWVKVSPDVTAAVKEEDRAFELEAKKLGAFVDIHDVVKRGAANFFAADAVRLTTRSAQMTVATLDAPITGIGELWPFPTRDSELPEGAPAFAFNLVNNIWGTNFIFWYPWSQQGPSSSSSSSSTTSSSGGGQPQWNDGANATYRFTVRWAADDAAVM